MPDTSEYRPLEGLPIPIAVLRAERVAYANPALTAMLGVPLEELSRLSMLDIIGRFIPREQSWLEPLYAARTRGERPPESQLWMRMRGTAGHERTCHVRVTPGTRPDEQLVVVLDMEQEDSVHRLTEALVSATGAMLHCRDEQAVLETAVEAIHQQGFFVAVLRLEGDSLVHGPMRQDPEVVTAAERLYGCPMHEVRFPRESVPHVQAVLTQRKAAFFQDIHMMLEHFHAPEVAALLKHTFPNTPSLDAPIFVGGTPLGILSVQGRSLSPASASTLELFAGLVGSALENVRHHREAAERLAELARLQAEHVAQERLTVLGQAAGVVAHEVRNPLGAILNVVAVLKREARLGPIGTSAVSMLEEEVIRLDDIVRDLLDVVRPFELRPRSLHLGELARRTAEFLTPLCEVTQVQIHIEEEEGLPPLPADDTLLQLALANLLRYTLRSSPTGGTVRLALARAPLGLSLVVEDQGATLSGTDFQHVFEPFFTSRATGAGLGLAVVRRVVLAHGGQIHVRERMGGGARFEVLLPLCGSEAREKHPAA
ncbi:sensor histidine kinase [Hyalangium rubrum]|uniref:histidine kinase n=1 Tax=Hyalangium rubrum TaxID=3103134 RepID=A0ABU5HEY7_9BACT|nr:ATP-binding protein [Hyalangium sp. s54d21]MDY7232037.1 ATP-binding protein [Hyalangium sp. s54d21]